MSEKILLGWPTRSEARRVARANNLSHLAQKHQEGSLGYILQYAGDGHLVTFAPTGAGKGVSCIIPNLLNYTGPVIVIDPKGENFAVTAGYRRSINHRIYLLDPFHAVDERLIEREGVERSRLNPLDLCKLSGASHEHDSQMLATIIGGKESFGSDPFWDICAKKLLAGLIAHEMERSKKEARDPSLANVVQILFSEDTVYAIAVLINEQEPSEFVKRSLASGFISIAEKTRDGILVTAQSYLAQLTSESLLASLTQSTIDLSQIQDTEDYTLYLVIPPTKLASHAVLLRIWVAVLMHAVMERRSLPSRRTLFMLDECAQLGQLDELKKAVTLLRGYGLQVWLFFQDVAQLEQIYGEDHRTIVNNCGVVQTFGISRLSAAAPLAGIVGMFKPDQLLSIGSSQQLISVAQRKPKISRKLLYFQDPAFIGRFSPNPLVPSPSNTKRL